MKYTKTQIEEAISIWKRMLGEAFNVRPDEIDQADPLEKSVYDSCRRLPRDSYHGSILWNLYLKDKIRLPKNELEELYGKHGFQELEDNLKYYDNIIKDADFDKIRIGNLDFVIKDNQGLQQLRSAKGIRVVSNAIFNKINSGKTVDSSFDPQYRLDDKDRNNIRFLGQTQDFVVFSTKTFESTNKFIYHVWRNSNMNTPYGNGKDDSACKINSPFCTRQSKQHWSQYSGGDPEYMQFWMFLKPRNFKAGSLEQTLAQMAFRGYDLLVGIFDTYNNNNDRFDGTCEFPTLYFFDKAGNDVTKKVEDQVLGKLVFAHVDENLGMRMMDSKTGPGYIASESDLNAQMGKLAEDYLRGKPSNKKWRNYLTEFRIPDDVSVIPERAFNLCTSLKSIVIPEGVTEIGSYAFNLCRLLKSVVIPEGVTKIGSRAFASCESLTSVTIPKSVTEVGWNVFDDCMSLTSVTIPEGMTEISPYIFRYCKSLESVSIPGSVTKICEFAFDDCESLTSVVIPEGVTEICDYAFQGCKSLTSISIPESVTKIGLRAFASCESLTSVTIPKSVTSISKFMFSSCMSLTSVVIPESVTKIDQCAFRSCKSLISTIIPEGVTEIGNRAFAYCGSLKSVVIPESVTKIGQYAFTDCGSLTSVAIPEGVTEIGESMFSGCESLTSVVIPEGVTEIGEYAFYDCGSLKSVVIPEGVTEIGDYAFADCQSIEHVIVPNEEIKEMLIQSGIHIPENIIEIKPKPLSESRHIEYLAHMLDEAYGPEQKDLGDRSYYAMWKSEFPEWANRKRLAVKTAKTLETYMNKKYGGGLDERLRKYVKSFSVSCGGGDGIENAIASAFDPKKLTDPGAFWSQIPARVYKALVSRNRDKQLGKRAYELSSKAIKECLDNICCSAALLELNSEEGVHYGGKPDGIIIQEILKTSVAKKIARLVADAGDAKVFEQIKRNREDPATILVWQLYRAAASLTEYGTAAAIDALYDKFAEEYEYDDDAMDDNHDKFIDMQYDYVRQHGGGEWRTIDTDMEIYKDVTTIMRATPYDIYERPDEAIPLISRLIDQVHVRGDLATAFVEGGSPTCWATSNMKPDEVWESGRI